MASSTFAANESPISEGGTWTSGPGAYIDINTSGGNAAASSAVGGWCAARYAAGANADQWSEIVVTAVASTELGAMVRMQAGGTCGGYLALLDPTVATIRVYRVDDAGTLSFNLLGSALSTAFPAVNDRYRLEARGSTLYIWHNFRLIGTRTDTTYTSGAPGFAINASTSGAITDWNGGSLTDTTDGFASGGFVNNSNFANDLVTDIIFRGRIKS